MIKIEVHSTRAVIRYQEPLTVGLRGAKVRFSFGAPWEGLIKTAVFRQGDKTVTVADIGTEATVPWEVLMMYGMPVQIGVYGIDGTGQVAIPTVWVETAPVRSGADPEGDPSSEPSPGLWEQFQSQMGSLEQLKTADKSSLVGAINEANHGVCLVTVTQREDGTYEADLSQMDVLAAYNAGKTLYCKYSGLLLQLICASPVFFIFGCVYSGKVYTVNINRVAITATTEPLASGDGTDGITPHIGDNGNWFIGETDTGVKAEGSDGQAGSDGISVTHEWDGTVLKVTSGSGTTSADLKGDKGDKGDTGPAGKNGSDYVLTEADKAEIAAAVIESLGGNPVFGYVDENNKIIVSGKLPEGTYTVKYELEDGSTLEIGDLVLGEVQPDEPTVNYTNQIPISTDAQGDPFNGGQGWKTGARLSLSSGSETTSGAADYECTGFIPATKTDTIRIKNIDVTEENATNVICYDSNKQPIAVNGAQYGTTLHALFVQYGTQSGDVYTSALNRVTFLSFPSEVAFIRMGSRSITADSILTVNEAIV